MYEGAAGVLDLRVFQGIQLPSRRGYPPTQRCATSVHSISEYGVSLRHVLGAWLNFPIEVVTSLL